MKLKVTSRKIAIGMLVGGSVLISTLGFSVATLTADDSPYRYAIIQIPELPGGGHGGAKAINDLGHVVGFSDTDDGSHPFFWNGNEIIDLGTFGGRSGQAWDINNRDEIVGVARNTENIEQAFYWMEGRLENLGNGTLWLSRAYSINEIGQIVGEGGLIGDDIGHPILWDDGKTIVLPEFDPARGGGEVRDINDHGVMSGTSWAGTAPQATVWKDGQFKLLGSLGDGTDRSHAWRLNNHNVIVGQSEGIGSNSIWYATAWVDGKIKNLSKLDHDFGARIASAISINDHGTILGNLWSRKYKQSRPYLYKPDTGFEIITDFLPPNHRWDFNFFLAWAEDINIHNQIAGSALIKDDHDQQIHPYFITPVNPEITLEIADGPLHANQLNTLKIKNAQPHATIKFFYGKQGGGKFIPGCAALAAMTQINDPVNFGEVVTDADGNAQLEILVPAKAATHKGFLIQALDFGNCEESQLVLKKVE